MKTPLASTDLGLKLLEDERLGHLSTEQKQIVTELRNDNIRMIKLVSELLDLSQIETGNLKLQVQQTDLKEIIQFSLDAVRPQAEQKKLELKLNIEDILPPVQADREKIAWVLVNLLTNAIRYSSAGKSITITAALAENHQVKVTVKDEGPGIDPQYFDKIFERYFKVPGEPAAKKGTGLGLAISKEFIEAMGGSIGVSSKVNEGSDFYFLLPIATSA